MPDHLAAHLQDALADLDAAMHTIWLRGDWRALTEPMTDSQREAAAQAVERHLRRRHLNVDGELRWWR